jgi:hypothetical protein
MPQRNEKQQFNIGSRNKIAATSEEGERIRQDLHKDDRAGGREANSLGNCVVVGSLRNERKDVKAHPSEKNKDDYDTPGPTGT